MLFWLIVIAVIASYLAFSKSAAFNPENGLDLMGYFKWVKSFVAKNDDTTPPQA